MSIAATGRKCKAKTNAIGTPQESPSKEDRRISIYSAPLQRGTVEQQAEKTRQTHEPICSHRHLQPCTKSQEPLQKQLTKGRFKPHEAQRTLWYLHCQASHRRKTSSRQPHHLFQHLSAENRSSPIHSIVREGIALSAS